MAPSTVVAKEKPIRDEYLYCLQSEGDVVVLSVELQSGLSVIDSVPTLNAKRDLWLAHRHFQSARQEGGFRASPEAVSSYFVDSVLPLYLYELIHGS